MTNAEQAWRKGLDAGRAELPAGANPYEPGSPLAKEWHDGWQEGTHSRNWPVEESDNAWLEPWKAAI